MVDADGPVPDRQIGAEIAQKLDVQVIPSIRGERFGGGVGRRYRDSSRDFEGLLGPAEVVMVVVEAVCLN